MSQKIGYYPKNGGSYDLPINESRTFAGEDLKPGEDNEIEDGWWNAYCIPGNEVFVMSRCGVLRLLEEPKITLELKPDARDILGLPPPPDVEDDDQEEGKPRAKKPRPPKPDSSHEDHSSPDTAHI